MSLVPDQMEILEVAVDAAGRSLRAGIGSSLISKPRKLVVCENVPS